MNVYRAIVYLKNKPDELQATTYHVNELFFIDGSNKGFKSQIEIGRYLFNPNDALGF